MKKRIVSLARWPQEWLLLVSSFLWGLATMFFRKIHFSGSVFASWKENTFETFGWEDVGWLLGFTVLGYIVLKGVCFFAAKMREKEYKGEDCEEREKGRCFLCGFFVFLFAWMPYLLSFAPGNVLEDSLLSISEAMGTIPLNNHHPVAYTLFVEMFIRLGAHIKSVNFGVFLYTICQYVLMAASLAYFVSWLWKKGASKFVCAASMGYFAFVPIFPIYATIMWKDPLFSCALLLYTLWIYDAVQSNGKLLHNLRWLAGYGGLSFVIIFFRNNGFLVFLITSVALLLVFWKEMKQFCMLIVVLSVLSAFIQGPMYRWLGIQSVFAESVGVPLQQICRVVVTDGEVTEEQKDFVYKLIPEKEIKSNYQPCLVDSIKWNSKFNSEFLESHKAEFLKIWAEMLVPNFGEYVKAYAMDTFGFWAPEIQNKYGYAEAYIAENEYEIYRVDLWGKLFGTSIADRLGYVKIQIGSGTLLWCMVTCATLLLYQGRRRECLVFFPALLTWMTIMIATPVAFGLRYVYILALGLPLFVVLPFKREEKL